MDNEKVISVQEGIAAHNIRETLGTAVLMGGFAREIHEVLTMLRDAAADAAHQIDPQGYRKESDPMGEVQQRHLIEANEQLKALLPQLRELCTEIKCVGISVFGGF